MQVVPCPECGTLHTLDAQFCSHCGHRFHGAHETEGEDTALPHISRVDRFVGKLLLGAGGFFFVWVLLSPIKYSIESHSDSDQNIFVSWIQRFEAPKKWKAPVTTPESQETEKGLKDIYDPLEHEPYIFYKTQTVQSSSQTIETRLIGIRAKTKTETLQRVMDATQELQKTAPTDADMTVFLVVQEDPWLRSWDEIRSWSEFVGDIFWIHTTEKGTQLLPADTQQIRHDLYTRWKTQETTKQ